ncbi:hybrid sensor histidine kinase/response regulator [Terrihabitans soli]|uniref:histidine kinase n=1 Tax=Terrihabitans soli TaxID=708113 RepID=A0A6S6QI94_9HYPH|nr:hybrid sensor histidine kinase/response regulator [Terrihabitans soli]BCJ90963.1 hybrid sensor histidine kinase/response regulator [Terrihabitans soli]
MTGASEKGRTARLIEAVGSVRLLGFLLVASVVLPVLLFAGFSYLSYRAHYVGAETRLAQTLDVVHEHMRKVLEAHELAALHISDLLAGKSDADIRRDELVFHARLATLKNAMPQVRDLRVLDAGGRPVVSASIYPFTTAGDVTEADFFRVHRSEGPNIYISEVMTSRNRVGSFFLETRRWEDADGNFRGIVAISVEPSYYHRFFSGFPQGNVFSLVREDGAVLARYPDPGIDAPARLPAGRGLLSEIAQSPDQGTYRAISSVDGVERIASYRRLPNSPLYITANFSLPEVRAAWRNDMMSHILLAGPATFGLFLITLLAYSQARREHEALEQLRREIDLRQRTEAQLLQSQKMEAVGRLTGGIAHDFNNLLTVVLGNLETIARQMPKANERLQRAVGNARMGAERAASLTHRLLAFSRRQPLEVKPVDLNALVAGMADLMRRTIGETIAIESRLGAGLWMTEADSNQIENALLNLVINARDAMPDGGRLKIETGNADLEDEDAAKKAGVSAGNYVKLCVTDSGAGIPKDVLDMVFEPFFTTKPTGQGTGLGLSMVYGFMQQTGGHVRIESEPGRGTTVRLYFPRSDMVAEISGTRLSDLEIEPTGNGETILVCEDDEGVRQFSVQTLRDFGYRVVEARDMKDALTRLDDNPGVVALFTDVVLPGEGNGRMLADEARRRRPDLRVLFTTGYTRDAIVRDGKLEDGVELLTKPFSSADLGRRIHALFAAKTQHM